VNVKKVENDKWIYKAPYTSWKFEYCSSLLMIMIKKKIWNTKGKQEGEESLSLRQNKEQEGVWDCIITKE
jgi:hypothetical protein